MMQTVVRIRSSKKHSNVVRRVYSTVKAKYGGLSQFMLRIKLI